MDKYWILAIVFLILGILGIWQSFKAVRQKNNMKELTFMFIGVVGLFLSLLHFVEIYRR